MVLISLRQLLDHAALNGYGVLAFNVTNKGIKHGVRKVNIDTDLRLAATGAARKYMAENPKNFDPRKFLAEATNAMKELCRSRFLSFGTAGWAYAITPIRLDSMANTYIKGN